MNFTGYGKDFAFGLAMLTQTTCEFLCECTYHVGSCWLLRTRLYRWATHRVYVYLDEYARAMTPTVNVPSVRDPAIPLQPTTITTTTGGWEPTTTVTWTIT